MRKCFSKQHTKGKNNVFIYVFAYCPVELEDAIERHRKKLVIVEGKNDKAALEKLGFTKIVCVDGTPEYKLIESIHEKEILILTDLDKEGRKKYAALSHQFKQRGVSINNDIRNLLFKTKIRQIEGLHLFQ